MQPERIASETSRVGITQGQPFWFIVGVPRSGTTLLRSFLNSHSQIYVPPEGHHVAREIRRSRLPGWSYEPRRFARSITSHRRFALWDLDGTEVRELFDDARPPNLTSALHLLYGHAAARHGRARYADKTPSNLWWLKRILAAVPSARFIHLVRDPLDVVASLSSVPEWGPSTPLLGAVEWARQERLFSDLAASVPPHRVLTIRYEDLVSNPEEALSTVTDAFGVDYEPGMLDRTSAARDASQNFHPHHHARLTGPLTRSRRSAELDESDVVNVLAVVGEQRRGYGYPRVEAGGRPDRLAISRARTRSRLATTRRSLRLLGGTVRDRVITGTNVTTGSDPQGNHRTAQP